jgi:hypothetical protein
MPDELKDLYEHTLRRIEPEYAEESHIMLQIAICALDPLPLETFIKATIFTLLGKEPKDQSLQSMLSCLTSRSGGLLEAVENAPFEGSEPQASGGLEPQTLDSASNSTGKSPMVVQFIHQTVKEYVQSRKSDLGGNGYKYLLGVGARGRGEWANEIGLHIFQYANLVETYSPDVDIEGDLTSLVGLRAANGTTEGRSRSSPLEFTRIGTFSVREPGEELKKGFQERPELPSRMTRLDWWLELASSSKITKYLEFYKYYNVIRILGSDQWEKLMILAIAADLTGFIRGVWRTRFCEEKPELGNWMSAALVGPKIAPCPKPRCEMVLMLLDLGIPVDTFIETSFTGQFLSTTPLELLLLSRLCFPELGEAIYDGRLHLIRILLENGADANCYLRCTPRYKMEDPAIFHCKIRICGYI